MNDKGTPSTLVGILVYDQVEVLDFAGPFEVFSTTRLDEARRAETDSPFDIRLIAEHKQVITTAGGMMVVPHHDFDDCPDLNILVVPGGRGARREISNIRLMEWLREQSDGLSLLAGVCTGSMLLGQAGLLEGLRATTHWRSLEWMREYFPDVMVVEDEFVVDAGSVITSAGISAGIDMALQLVLRFHGQEVARAAARYMEYPFPENSRRRMVQDIKDAAERSQQIQDVPS
ncbi:MULTISPECIES: DJ-1/PfpI family protein [unclassified Ectothiorhodospira]|uniref:DJ-1/PfpI family protein n=1 Tax=unclassified Ectothiorhodospira TaxID=2684909 RepID=UPI001EE7F4CE|nr:MULTISPECIES: DJ-1/PfpI family protein [unclassified Ectothiorhodospira]MCG5514554.1 DJ-1/PfpI family protein [Ectothiorhodospira sp. 9100]MCG5518642.1 DJ-1/PfpI family protein [Ectothiorhodospira sp. 9905]